MAPEADDETLHPWWRGWIADNLARGATVDEVVDALVEEAVPEHVAREHAQLIFDSPGLQAARRLANRVRAIEQIARLRREHREDFGGDIPRVALPDAEEVRTRYLAPGVPAIFNDLVTRWPAFEKWTPGWLAEHFGDVEVTACVGREGKPKPDADWAELVRKMTLRELVDRITTDGNDTYVISKNGVIAIPELAPLLNDLALPSEIFGPEPNPARMGLWIGAAGTHTPLHHDGDNSFFCQVHGRKRVRLAPPESLALLDRANGVYSEWDPKDKAELASGPEHLVEVVVQAGEALLIPAGWWHQVDALEPSITVTILELAWDNDYGWYRPGTLLRGRSVER